MSGGEAAAAALPRCAVSCARVSAGRCSRCAAPRRAADAGSAAGKRHSERWLLWRGGGQDKR